MTPPPITPEEDARRKQIVLLCLAGMGGMMGLIVIFALLTDAFFASAWGGSYTYSWLILQSSHVHPAIPFLAAVLFIAIPTGVCCHIFLTMRGDGVKPGRRR